MSKPQFKFNDNKKYKTNSYGIVLNLINNDNAIVLQQLYKLKKNQIKT